MNENLYAAPQAQLIEPMERDDRPQPFYIVSLLKFNVLFYLTVGVYSIYWFYRHWKAWKIRSREDIWPVPRSIFSLFFVHSLFGRFAENLALEQKRNGMIWATVYVLASIASNVISRLAGEDFGWWDLGSLVCFVAMGLACAYGQQLANEACEDPQGRKNAHFSAANIVWILVGGLFWLVVLAGAALILTTPEL